MRSDILFYYISDLHLGHANVMEFDKRPFQTLDEMHTAIIQNWNSVVTEDDIVFILGDLAWKRAVGLEILPQLKGSKVLIIGNHDYKMIDSFRKFFLDVLPYHEMIDCGMHVILSHYPIAHWNGQLRDNILIYGHVHNSPDWETFDKYIADCSARRGRFIEAYNVGCMMPYMNYTPRTLNEIRSILF